MGGENARHVSYRAVICAGSVALALAGSLAGAGVAAAADFTWSGASTAPSWSDASNWSGGAAPSGSVGALAFPALGSAACAASPPPTACYQSTNDSSVTATSIAVDDGIGYTIAGNAIPLAGGGITAAPSAADPVPSDSRLPTLTLTAPLDLVAPQTWSITGGPNDPQILVGGAVADPSSAALAINLSQAVSLAFTNAEVGPVTATGDGNPQHGAVELGFFDKTGKLTAGAFNATDGQTVGFTGGAGLFALDGSIGPTTMAAGIVQIGESDQAGTLAVSGSVSINGQSELLAYINGPGTTAGTDYSQITATGDVSLGGAALLLGDGEVPGTNACERLDLGDVLTLVKTSGTLSGAFAGVSDGATVPLHCFGVGGAPPSVTIHYDYVHGTVTATVATSGSPAATSMTSLSASPASPVTNQPVTLTATVASSTSAPPVGGVAFDQSVAGASVPIPGCESVALSGTGSSATATCTTSFAAARPASVSATFTPADGSGVASSASAAAAVQATPAATTTTVAIAPASVGLNQTTVYTATVTPSQPGGVEPTGSVTFLAAGQPIGATPGGTGCTAVPLTVGASSSSAACHESFVNGTGTVPFAITATYSGDANFSASSAAPQNVTVVGASGPPAQAPTASKLGHAVFGLSGATATMADLIVTCKGTRGQRCTVTLKLTTREKTTAGKLVSASAAKTTERTVAVGTRTVTLAAGIGETIHVKLNAAGLRALARLNKLPVALRVTQTTSKGASKPLLRRFTFKARSAR